MKALISTAINGNLKTLIQHWPYIDQIARAPTTSSEYENLVKILDRLLDIAGSDETHELASLIRLIGRNIEEYEALYQREVGTKASGVDALKFLMQQHNLRQTDLPEIGPQSVVSAILHGKRRFNARQLQELSERFKVSANLFF